MNLSNEGESPGGGDQGGVLNRPPLRFGDLQKTITMAQIAKAAGVSQGAISSLLNDRDYGIRVSEKTRERVFKVCREMGYLPNDLRAVVRMYPELGEFALLIPARFSSGLAQPFVARVATAAMRAVPEPARSLTLAFYDEALDYLLAPERLPHPVAAGTVSKFLFLGAPSPSLIQTITRRGCPVVVLGHEVPLPGVHSIVADLASASQLVIEHLLKLGHKQLAIVSGPFGSADAETIELNRGVRLACEQFGITVDARNVIFGDLSAGAGMAALDALLERTPAPTAIFCLSDAAAEGVLSRAQARGKDVPKQLSVIGCGDDPCAASSAPPLTTVRLPFEEMAQLGVQEVDQLVRGGGLEEARRTVLPVSLIERSSCAPPPKAKP
jgi:DNA-binding LacI/PurR family transcriptional regulator